MRLERILPNLALAFASTLFVLLVFEAGFRLRAHLGNRGLLAGQRLGTIEMPADGTAKLGHMIRLAENRRVIYELKPHLSVVYEGARVTTDGEGFRTDGGEPTSSDDTFTIVGIGDSFMFGQGVADDEPYLAVLGAELRRRRPGRSFRTVNTAVPGYNTAMEVATLRSKGLRYSPDLVIVEFVSNDLLLPNFLRHEEPMLSLRKSFLIDFFRQRQFRQPQTVDRIGLSPAPEQGPAWAVDPDDVPPEYRDMVGWEGYERALGELQALREEHGFEVLSITLNPKEDGYPERAFEFAGGLGFHVLDVGAQFRAYLERGGYATYEESPLALHPMDGHPSALGHRLAAEAILEFLEKESLLDPRD